MSDQAACGFCTDGLYRSPIDGCFVDCPYCDGTGVVQDTDQPSGGGDEVSEAMESGDQPAMPTQADVLAWVARRWPDRTTPIWRAAKLCEEAGEVIGAVIKTDEGRKTNADVAQETAQAVICCMGVAETVGFDLWAEVAAEWQRCNPPTPGRPVAESKVVDLMAELERSVKEAREAREAREAT